MRGLRGGRQPVVFWSVVIWRVNGVGILLRLQGVRFRRVPFSAGAFVLQGAVMVIGIAVPYPTPGYVAAFSTPRSMAHAAPVRNRPERRTRVRGGVCPPLPHHNFVPITVLGAFEAIRTGIRLRAPTAASTWDMTQMGPPPENAPRVNLFLRVLARKADGYHGIETLFCRIGLADTLDVERTDGGITLDVEGADLGATEENLAWRAADAVLQATGRPFGVRMKLIKRIPAGAGLGADREVTPARGAVARRSIFNPRANHAVPRAELLCTLRIASAPTYRSSCWKLRVPWLGGTDKGCSAGTSCPHCRSWSSIPESPHCDRRRLSSRR